MQHALWDNFRMSMEEQLSLAATGFERHSKTTRRTKFLLEMDRIVPWKRLRKIVRPFYYKGKASGAGRSSWSGCCASTFCSIGST